MPSNPSLALFLGAGFSCEAGLETMEGFAAASKSELAGIQKHVNATNDDFRFAAGMLYEAGLTYEEFREWIASRDEHCQVDTRNVEAVFCLAESIRQSVTGPPSSNISLARSTTSLDYIEEQIRLWLWKVYQRCPMLARPDIFSPEPYESFAQILRDSGIASNTYAITTNYDIVFEYACWRASIPCGYGGRAQELPLLPDQGRYADTDGTGGPIVCKLHGSVNWFVGSEHMHERLGMSVDLGASGELVGRSPIDTTRPRIFALDAIWKLRSRFTSRLVPAIIPPTFAKSTGYEWARDIWQNAHRVLKGVDAIIFIGYSFPTSDGFMESFIQAAMVARGAKPLRVAVVNPQPEVHDRIKRIFKNVEAWPTMKFSQSLDRIRSLIDELRGPC